MADVFAIAGFVFFSIVLFAAGTALLRSMIVITRFLRLPFFTSSFILLALGTSLPELFVGIQAGLAKVSELTVGVVIGSNIADMTLVTGIWLVFVRRVKIQNAAIISKDCIWMVVLSMIPIILMFLFGQLTRLMGALLVGLFIAYAVWLMRRQPRTAPETNHIGRWRIVGATLIFAVSLVALFWSSDGIVEYSTRLAIASGLPYIFVGLFLVSFGTSLPELIVQLKTGRAKGGHIGLGNIIGSVITNSTLVLGISILISPAMPNAFLFLTSALFLVFIGLLYTQFVRSGTMTAFQGMILIILFVLFIVVELTIKGLIPSGL